jgi:hypothetical protein
VSSQRRAAILKTAIPALLVLSFSSSLHSQSEPLQFEMLSSLPQPGTNNAVALLPDGQGFTDMPVPVDDAVVLVYQGRVFFAGGGRCQSL